MSDAAKLLKAAGNGAPAASCGAWPFPPVRFGIFAACILALGLAVRAWLFATGRAALDGDEAVMGVMSYDLSRLARLPLYFYRQHYMGSLEIPPVALLMRLGPEAWKFSVWPIRLVEAGYFAGLAAVHFKLAGRLFGRNVAHWALLFICIGPIYWMDYSSRLRHVTLMMLLGEAMALLALRVVSRWEGERRVGAGSVIALGILAGAAWWHYQLVVVYYVGLLGLIAMRPGVLRACFVSRRNSAGGEARIEVATVARAAAMAACALFLAGLSLGWGSQSGAPYAVLVGLPLIAFAALGSWSWKVSAKSERGIAPALTPALVMSGFLLGAAPSLVHLLLLGEAYWVSGITPQWTELGGRLMAIFTLDMASMLEITTPSPETSALGRITARSWVNLSLYLAALYVLGRKLIAPANPAQRVGAVYVFTIAATLVALHLFTPRPTNWNSPRFLVPLFTATSIMLALLAAELTEMIGAEVAPAARRFAGIATVAVLFVGALLLWASPWRTAFAEPLHPWSGHRASTIEIIEALHERGIERVQLPYDLSSYYGQLAYELIFASRMQIRFYGGGLSDRFKGTLDENSYAGEMWALSKRNDDDDPSEQEPQGFWVGEFFIYPAPGQAQASSVALRR